MFRTVSLDGGGEIVFSLDFSARTERRRRRTLGSDDFRVARGLVSSYGAGSIICVPNRVVFRLEPVEPIVLQRVKSPFGLKPGRRQKRVVKSHASDRRRCVLHDRRGVDTITKTITCCDYN